MMRAMATTNSELPPPPWIWRCNRCHAEAESEKHPGKCANCGNPEFAMEHGTLTEAKDELLSERRTP